MTHKGHKCHPCVCVHVCAGLGAVATLLLVRELSKLAQDAVGDLEDTGSTSSRKIR
jgi:hypothetical protein